VHARVHSDHERSFSQTRPMIDDRYGVVSARRRWRLMKTDDRPGRAYIIIIILIIGMLQ